MKFNLYDQFSVSERADLLLGKYPLSYLKDIINGTIQKSRKENDTHVLNYWNEVAIEIKRRVYGK